MVDISSTHETTNPEICNSTSHLSLLLWNARSLNNQINNFQSYIYSENYEIIAITETWLQNSTYSNEILPSGYMLLRKDRDSRGGGVMLALRDSIAFKQLSSPNDLEVIAIEIETTFVMCLIYRPPNSVDQYNHSLLSYLNSLDGSKNTIIIGDLNLPDADWNTYSSCSPLTDEFMDLSFNLNLSQLVVGPTHCAGNTLDVVLANFDDLCHIGTYKDLPAGLTSDHYIIILSIEQSIHKRAKINTVKFDYNHANWDDINLFLYHYDFTLALSSNNTEFIWSYIKVAITSAMNLFIPKVSITGSDQPKWFTPTIRHEINCVRTLKRQLNNHFTESKRLKLMSLQSELQHMIARAKSDYETNLALTYSHSNNNRIFQYISSIKGQDHYPIEMSYNDKLASSDSDKAQIFNEYFYSVFSDSNPPIDDIDLEAAPTSAILNDIVISESDVYDMLVSLDVNKASGIDNISPKLFKNCALPLLQIICHLFTVSLCNGEIPKDWRTHCVVPIFKSGDKSSVCNYRPISLLCILSKVLERIVYNSMLKHVEGSLTKHQFGFLPNRSTLQQLLTFTNEILEAKTEVDVVYMDFRKAFDSVSHNGLLVKLNSIGITGKLWLWLKEYLQQ